VENWHVFLISKRRKTPSTKKEEKINSYKLYLKAQCNIFYYFMLNILTNLPNYEFKSLILRVKSN
jgi:hypothetical protein